MTCDEFQPLLAAHADAALTAPERAAVDAHVAGCVACREALAVQQAVRQAIRTHAADLAVPAPPGLHTRVAASLAPAAAVAPGWSSRVSAFAAAAIVVLALGAVLLPVATWRSTVVLAAQMALDHLKCFSIDGDAHAETLTVAEAQRELLEDYGWRLDVPPTGGDADGRLVAVRRCLYGDGRAAHLLYRVGDTPVSLFILPGQQRPAEQLQVFGQATELWSQGGHTFLLVAAAEAQPRLARMASTLRNGAE
ncbi:MAG: zf-HC2 domain-containing protein [Acidobacteria bacterium]|nr:zf-HC2 domain-containing protein [Acidobacteriota bacterium]